ncbi:MAG: hypothetical protein ABWX83_08615 [Luteibacter sp.]
MRILQSLEEFLYEAMSWVVFYPRAIIRTIRHPVAVAVYTREQLSQPRELQFSELISPPLLLILTVLIAHLIELATPHGMATTHSAMGKELFSSEQGIIATRSLAYCIFALLGSFTWLRHERKPANRDTLREPFYIHCYLLAPFALGLAIATTVAVNAPGNWGLLTAPMYLVSCLWYVVAQTAIYARMLKVSKWRAFWLACRANFIATVVLVCVVLVVFGIG